MSTAPSTSHAPSRGWRTPALTILLAASLFAGLAWWMRAQDAAAAARAHELAATPPRPLAEVTSAVRAAKLVTVEIDTSVRVERGDTSWRGDVSAAVTVPVRLHVGTDLSKITGVGFAPSAGEYVVRVPRPARIATEVFSEKEKAEVEAGGLRLRSRAGEYYLGLARRDAAPAARELVLRPDDAARVERVTREQVETLIKRLAGPAARVRVVFEGEP